MLINENLKNYFLLLISIRRIRLLKNIWQHLKTTLEKNTFNNEEVKFSFII